MKKVFSLEQWTNLMWGLTLLFLPVTSFRFFPSFFGDSMVRPLSLYPLVLLLPALAFLMIRKKWYRNIPSELIPFLGFLLVILITTLLGDIWAPPVVRDQSYWGRALRAWGTVSFGMAFFFASIWMNSRPEDIQRSLRWLYAGLGINFIWGVLQLGGMVAFLPFDLFHDVQQTFSVAGIDPTRINGFALEPSWLAADMITIYIPWLVAALYTGYRVSRFTWLEPLCLVMAVFLLIFSYSRSGIITAVVSAVLVFLLTGGAHIRRGLNWFFNYRKARTESDPVQRRRSLLLRAGILAAIVVLMGGLIYVLSSNPYFSQLWRSRKADPLQYAIDVFIGTRVAYAWAAFDIFLSFPWTGVGLGASGFYILSHLPVWSITYLAEIAGMLSPSSGVIPNPKNFLVRILVETGIIGFGFFSAFYFSVLGRVKSYLRGAKPLRFAGVAGLFIWLVLIMIYFSQDSFAMPNMWIGLGLLLGLRVGEQNGDTAGGAGANVA